MFKKHKSKEHDLADWELYPDYLEAIKAVQEFSGEKWTCKTTLRSKGGTVEQITEEVMTLQYATVIAERDKYLEAAEKYRENRAAVLEATKREGILPRVIGGIVTGVFGLGATVLSIFGKKWLEDHDSYDDGGVLTDNQKDAMRTMRPRDH